MGISDKINDRVFAVIDAIPKNPSDFMKYENVYVIIGFVLLVSTGYLAYKWYLEGKYQIN